MARVTIGKDSYATPYEHLLPSAPPEVLEAIEASIILEGILVAVIIGVTPGYGRIIIDGVTRARFAEKHGLDIPVEDRGHLSDEESKALCLTLNANRRHLTPETYAGLRVKIMTRIAACRAQGKSIRVTTQELKSEHPELTKSAVGRAIQALRQVSHAGTVDDEDEEDPDFTPFPAEPVRITGANGKSYLAARAPVIVAKVPPGHDRDAALIELGKYRKAIQTAGAHLEELLRGPLKKMAATFAPLHRKLEEKLKEVAAA